MDVMALRRGLLMSQVKKSRLPAEYQEVEYIQTIGRDLYIRSNILITEDLVMDLTFQCSAIPSGSYVVGEYKATGTFYLYIDSTNPKRVFQSEWASDYSNTSYAADTEKHKLTCLIEGSKSKLFIDNSLVLTLDKKNSMPLNNIIIAGSVHTNTIPSRTYEAKFTKAGELIGHYIPCYRKSDNEAGMYDIVNSTFHTKSGVGNFTVGPDVN